jgi:protein required for attachment to host cells
MKPILTWILIANTEKAKIFEHRGPGSGLTLLTEIDNPAPVKSFDDQQGRSFDSFGSHRHKMEPPLETANPFFGEIANRLRKDLEKGRFERLVLCAGPHNLGFLRQQMDGALQKAVIAEMTKNLVNTPEPSLSSHFEDVLPV